MNAIYCRVSTDEQVRKGYSLEDQRQSCLKHLLAMGFSDIEEYIDDGYSGEFLERPGLERLRDNIQTGQIKYIAIYDPDRLSRNLSNQLILADEIEKSGAQLTFVTGDYDCSPEGRLFFSMKGAIAAYEKAKIRERTCRGRRAKATKGKVVSNAHPFGYSWDKENSMYTINEEEASIVNIIYEMCILGELGARAIALALMRQGILGRKGKPLSICTVSRILSKEMYCGIHYQFKQSVRKTGQNTREIKNNPPELWIPVTIPAIVNRKTWEKAQLQIKKNKQQAKRNTKHTYLLQGVLKCGICGRNMTAYSRIGQRKTSPPKIYYYYSCISNESGSYITSGKKCANKRIPADILDSLVWQSLVETIQNESLINDYLFESHLKNYSDEIERLSKHEHSLQKKKSDITNWYRLNLIDSKSAEKELISINIDLETTISNILSITEKNNKIKQPALLPAEFLNILTLEEKRDIMLHFPYEIRAVRSNDDFKFWFQEC